MLVFRKIRHAFQMYCPYHRKYLQFMFVFLSQDQYRLLHYALQEALGSGDTTLSTSAFHTECLRSIQQYNVGQANRITDEFQVGDHIYFVLCNITAQYNNIIFIGNAFFLNFNFKIYSTYCKNIAQRGHVSLWRMRYTVAWLNVCINKYIEQRVLPVTLEM